MRLEISFCWARAAPADAMGSGTGRLAERANVRKSTTGWMTSMPRRWFMNDASPDW